MKKKMILVCICSVGILCTVLAAVLISTNYVSNDNKGAESLYNPDPDVSGKVVGSRSGSASRAMPRCLDDVIFEATCVVIGKVVDDGTTTVTEIDAGFGITNTLHHTIAVIEVSETLVGECPAGDLIRYRQIGSAGDDRMQTKVEEGKTYIFILKYFDEIDQYMATAFEESVFYINEESKLLSMSDLIFCAKYDNINIAVLIKDLESTYNRVTG